MYHLFVKKKIFFIFILISMFFFVSIIIYKFYLVPRIYLQKDMPKIIETTEAKNAQTNVFENILEEKKFLEEYNLLKNFAESSPMMLALSVSGTILDGSAYPSKIDYEKILPAGGIAVRAKKDADSVTYKIIYTRNRYFSGKEFLDFPILVDANHLIVLDTEKDSLSYMWEIPEYSFPDSISDDNVIVLLCATADCTDKKIAWVLVF